MSEWISCEFGSLYAEPSRNGLTKPKSVRGHGVKFVNMGEIFRHDRLKNLECDRVPLAENEKFALLKNDDLLFARQSLVLAGAGKCSIFLGDVEEVAFESHIIRVRLDQNKANPQFYYYLFRSPQGRSLIEAIVEQGAGASGVRSSDLKSLMIPYTSLPEQRAIAHILGTLDDKIELNRKMNHTLESMARAIFKSWFVDFDPVRAKMEGRQPAAMDAETAALFPDSFERSELGEIPKGWRVRPLPEIIDVNPTRSLSKGKLAPYLDMKNMPTQGHHPDEWIYRPFGSGTKFINGDTLMARITPCLENGKTAFVDFLEGGQVGWGSTEYIIFRPKPPFPCEYGYYLACSDELRAYAILNMTGSSGRQRTPPECFWQYLLAVPSEPIALKCGEVIKPLMATIRANSDQSRTLTAIRDTLLPKLMSGEIRVKDAEQMVEEVI